MYQLHVGLKNSGIECKILSAIKTLELLNLKRNPHSPRGLDYEKITSKLGLNNIHCGSFKSVRMNFIWNADIINFHVIHSGFSAIWQFPVN